MAEIGLYVFGTSILWGQGHDDENKIHRHIEKWLARRHGAKVHVEHHAHSGAVLTGVHNKKRKRLYGEVPDPYPSIATQILKAPHAEESKVVILFDGGINDVGVFDIINPFIKREDLKARIRKACYVRVLQNLKVLGKKYETASVYVLGYFQILAGRVKKSELQTLFRLWSPQGLANLGGNPLVSRSIQNARFFREESDRQIHEATRKAGDRFTFVPSGFKASEGVFGKRSLLYKPFALDPKIDDRALPCLDALRKRRSGLECPWASTGHPNQLGVARYVKSLKTHMT